MHDILCLVVVYEVFIKPGMPISDPETVGYQGTCIVYLCAELSTCTSMRSCSNAQLPCPLCTSEEYMHIYIWFYTHKRETYHHICSS